MYLSQQIANQFTAVFKGGNWTSSNLKTHLEDITWQEATTKIESFNTIAALVYHITYYVDTVLGVLKGGPLTGKDKYSFDHPPINSGEDWQKMLDKVRADVTEFADLIAQMTQEKLFEEFIDPQYGNYYRNITGIIEHSHYHLGQIVFLKKILRNK